MCVFVLWGLPVADFGLRIFVATDHCTFDCRFRMSEPGRTVISDNGSSLSSAAEAIMLGVSSGGVRRVIYHSTYVGIVFRSLIFETSLFLTSTSKIR